MQCPLKEGKRRLEVDNNFFCKVCSSHLLFGSRIPVILVNLQHCNIFPKLDGGGGGGGGVDHM